MRILAIAPQPFFTPRGTPLSVYYRAMVSAEQGAAVDLLTYGAGQDVDLPGVTVRRIPRVRLLEPIPVGPSVRKLLLDILLVAWTVALCARHRYDAVHAHEESVFWCALLKPLFRFRLIYDMHSSLPQQLINFRFTRSKLLVGAFRALEDLALRRADAVITICPALAEHAVERMPDSGRHVLIENSIFEPVRVVPSGGKLGGGETAASDLPEGRPAVVYAGTFEPYQGIGLLIEAFARVAEERPEPILVLAGGEPAQVESNRRLAAGVGLSADRCVFTGRLSRARAQALTGQAAVLVSPRLHGTNTPLKIYEQLASGIPLVATRIEAHTQILSDDVAFLAAPDPEAFGAALLAALSDQEVREGKARAAARLYAERYARPAYEEKLRQALRLATGAAGA